MNNRFGLIFGAISAFAMLFYASLSIIKGGLINFGIAAALATPFVFIILINFRKVWHTLIPVLLTMNELTIPIYGLKKLMPILVFLVAATGILIVERAIKHSRRVLNFTWADRLIAVVALIMTVRFVHDRPGFVALGMGQGGFFRALTITSPAWFYFSVKALVTRADFTRRQLVYIAYAVAGVCAITLYEGAKSDLVWVRFLGGEPFWMLCALTTALLATATNTQKKWALYYLISLSYIIMGAVSQFRSRVFFFAAEVLSVSVFMRRFRKTIMIVGTCGVIGACGIIGITGKIPSSMARAASLFTSVDKVALSDEGSTGAYGWQDTGRMDLYRVAWEKIRRTPLVGKGFGLDVAEAIGILSVGRRVTVEMLILSDSYHNSIVMLAAKCGLPAAAFISLAFLIIIFRFVRWLRMVTDLNAKTWGMVIVAFWLANTFMMLMNGGPNEFFAELILSGFMMGMMNNSSISEDKGRTESLGIDAGAPRSSRWR